VDGEAGGVTQQALLYIVKGTLHFAFRLRTTGTTGYWSKFIVRRKRLNMLGNRRWKVLAFDKSQILSP
jgi:hypothetical protein